MCDDIRTCTSCSGTGIRTLECRVCDGTGEYLGTCINCEGSGQYYKEAQTCFQCSGTGRTKVQDQIDDNRGFAPDSSVVCGRCEGTGKYKDEVHGQCFRCNGKGTFRAPCRKCNAVGAFKTQCNRCRGTGRVRVIPKPPNDGDYQRRRGPIPEYPSARGSWEEDQDQDDDIHNRYE